MNKFAFMLSSIVINAAVLLSSCSGTKYAASSKKINTTPATTRQPAIITPQSHNVPQQLTVTTSTANALQIKYAQLLGIATDSVQNFKLYQFIDNWYHAPYKYAGRSRTGVDCSDFVSLLMDSVYNIVFNGSSATMFTKTTPVKKDSLQQGDLVFFKIAGDRISHIGFYLSNNKFVHASVAAGITISDLNEAYYKKYFFSGGRLTSN